MSFAADILRGLADSKELGEHIDDYALQALLDAYNHRAHHDDSLVPLGYHHTGKDLKNALAQLPGEDQLVMLYPYAQAVFQLLPYVEDQRSIDERRLRHWLVKAAFMVLAPIPCLIAGAMVVIAVREGIMPDGALSSSLMSTATEMLKLIFTSSL